MLVIIDTETGNLQSIANAFKRIGADCQVSKDIKVISSANLLVLPGVGSFNIGMKNLSNGGLKNLLNELVIDRKIPILGICLGMQLFGEFGEEYGFQKGLGFIKGNVEKLKLTDSNYRLPNIGWCDVTRTKKGILFDKNKTLQFYHVHSYYFNCKELESVAATIEFSGYKVPVAVEKENIFGVQFHPEKSQDDGLDLLYRFYKQH